MKAALIVDYSSPFSTTYPPDTAHSRNYSLSVRTVSSTHGDWLRVWVWPLIFWAVYVLHRTSHSSSLVSPKGEPIMCDLYKLHMCFRLHWSSYENRGQTQQQSWEGWEEQGVYLSWLRGTGHLSKEEIGSFSPSPPSLPLRKKVLYKLCQTFKEILQFSWEKANDSTEIFPRSALIWK